MSIPIRAVLPGDSPRLPVVTHDSEAPAAHDDESPWQLAERAMEQLINESHVASADELPDIVARASVALGCQDITMYLADLQQRVLVPFLPATGPHSDPARHNLGIDSTVAGRAFQQMQRLTQSTHPASDEERVAVWLPLLDGTERLGVLGVIVPHALLDDEAGARRLYRFTSVVAELLVSKTLYGDRIVRTRRTRPMSLAAEVQWSLLPPLTFVNQSVTIAGALEPAYEVAGDSLDYAVDAEAARFAVFDGMGHGIVSAQLISLVIAAYRNARRAGRSLTETAVHIEAAVNEVFRVESFATGLLCELDTTSGLFSWISAGHHEPLLLRGGRLVRALTVEPLLPLGLNQGMGRRISPEVGTEHLEPGDLLLLYTDGIIEARSPDGDFFGQARLVDMVTRNLAAGLPAPETMRRVVHALLDHQAGDLDDDATLLLVEWHGAPSASVDPARAAEVSRSGRRALDPG
jgi:serine/threonine protein phosphatase PrpC